MSLAHAKKFATKVATDKALRKELKLKAASDHVFKVAKKHGYAVTKEEMLRVMKQKWSKMRRNKKLALEDDPAAFCILSEPAGV